MMSGWFAALAVMAAVALSGRRRPAERLLAWQSSAAAERDVRWWVAVPLVGSGLVALRVPVPIVVVTGLTLVVVPRVRARRRATRERDAALAATVEVTFALAGELRAGHTPAQALAAVARSGGPLRASLEAAAAAVTVGGKAADELARAAAVPGAERLRYVAAAWAVAESAGGRVAIVLERLSESMDDDDELRRELDAAMSGPRATMVMLGCLPVLGLVLAQSVGAHPVRFLLDRPLGWVLMSAAAGLDAVGVVATRAIARTALRT